MEPMGPMGPMDPLNWCLFKASSSLPLALKGFLLAHQFVRPWLLSAHSVPVPRCRPVPPSSGLRDWSARWGPPNRWTLKPSTRYMLQKSRGVFFWDKRNACGRHIDNGVLGGTLKSQHGNLKNRESFENGNLKNESLSRLRHDGTLQMDNHTGHLWFLNKVQSDLWKSSQITLFTENIKWSHGP